MGIWRARAERSAPAFMALPALLFTIALIGIPLMYTGWISLHDWFLGGVGPSPFIGLANYRTMLADPAFWQALRITLEITVISLVGEVVLGIYIGLLLNREAHAVRWLRVGILFPSVMPSVAAGMAWLLIFDPTLGVLNYLLKAVGLGPLLWLDSPATVVPSLSLVDIWQWTPFVALIVLGGMQSLPPDPFEAAAIDGANDFQIFRYITLPSLAPIVWVAVILRSIDLLRVFDTIYVMTQGGPGTSSTSLNIYAYEQGFQFSHMGYACALMLVLFVIVVVINAVLAQLRRRATQ